MNDDLHLIAVIAGQRVALPAAAIESVVEVEAVTPIPRAPAHIAGLAALRSRVLTLVECNAALDLPPTRDGGHAARDAIVMATDGHLYGLLVDRVEDVVLLDHAPRPIRSGLAAGWSRVAIGMAEHDGAVLMVIDPAALLAPLPAAA